MSKHFKGFKSISQKIFVGFVLMLIIPLAMSTLANYYNSKSIIKNNSLEDLRSITSLVNDKFDQYMKDIETITISILANPQTQNFLKSPYVPAVDWSVQNIEKDLEIKTMLKSYYELKDGISSISIYGFNQLTSYFHPARRWDDSFDVTLEKWYQQTINNNGNWTLSGLREERQLFHPLLTEPEKVVTFSRLIKDLNSFKPLGIVAVNIKVDKLNELAVISQFPNQLVVLDQDGIPVISSRNNQDNYEDDAFIHVSSTSSFTNWTTDYTTEKNVHLEDVNKFRNFMLLVAFILLILAVIFAQIISNSISNPIRKLHQHMQLVGQGNYDFDISVDKQDEVGELTEHFNQMVHQVRDLIEKIRKNERDILEAELQAMQARINPHFMYNTLNGIRWVAMMEGNTKVAEALTSFSHLLKFSSKNQHLLIPIDVEVEMLQHYVNLMKLRSDKFEFILEIEEGMGGNLINSFILQPIVENSIFHGIIPLDKEGEVSVRLFVNGNQNVAIIQDNGVGISEDVLASIFENDVQDTGNTFTKIGLNNVYNRLTLQFGEQAKLVVSSKKGQGTNVQIRWPIINN